MKYKNNVAIIQARLTSTRFPNKIMAQLEGKTILQRIIDSVNKSYCINKVVVAIPKQQDIPFERAEKFEGDEYDVLDRYYQCAKHYKADNIIRITADCPLIDHKIINDAVNYFEKHRFPYVIFAPVSGFDVEVFSFKTLEKAWKDTNGVYEYQYEREHVTPYMQKISNLSVDTQEDLEKVKKWLAGERQLI